MDISVKKFSGMPLSEIFYYYFCRKIRFDLYHFYLNYLLWVCNTPYVSRVFLPRPPPPSPATYTFGKSKSD